MFNDKRIQQLEESVDQFLLEEKAQHLDEATRGVVTRSVATLTFDRTSGKLLEVYLVVDAPSYGGEYTLDVRGIRQAAFKPSHFKADRVSFWLTTDDRTFAKDITGVQEVRSELVDICNFLNHKAYKFDWIKMGKRAIEDELKRAGFMSVLAE